MNKQVKKIADRTLGVLIRAVIRYGILHPILLLLYKIEIRGEQDARSCTHGSIVAPNHVSYLDGPFLMSVAWPLARIRFVVWHEEYTKWLLWPFMKLCGAICAGSPKKLPGEERARRKKNLLTVMNKVLKSNRALGIFPQGKIAGEKVEIQPHLSGLYDLILNNPDKPLLLVKIDGLQFSKMGKCFPKVQFFTRLPVTVTIKRFDNVSLDGGTAEFNKRIENYFNAGVPLTVKA